MVRISRISFGGTAAITGSVAFIVGLNAADASRATIVSALLIAGLADNLTDSLSVHVYQESERLEPREAFIGTITNFAARLAIYIAFVLIVGLLPMAVAIPAALAFGGVLLAALTAVIARQRRVGIPMEVCKHLVVAAVVIVASRGIGAWIHRGFLS